jgi:hypothetical protein
MGKADVAKKAGIFVVAKKLIGKVVKLGMLAAAGSAVVKVLKDDDR